MQHIEVAYMKIDCVVIYGWQPDFIYRHKQNEMSAHVRLYLLIFFPNANVRIL